MTGSRSVSHTVSALLIAVRAALSPILLFDAIDGDTSAWFVWVFVVGLLSDVVDGEILRRFNHSTPKLRRLDSNADAAFYMSVLLSLWFVRPQIMRFYRGLLLALLATQLFSWMFCLIKFGKLTSYHSYLAKFWALALFMAIVSILTQPMELLLMAAILTGFLSHAEDMCITAMLPRWQVDVKSVSEACRRRQQSIRLELQHSVKIPLANPG